jgi:hypothetical protein
MNDPMAPTIRKGFFVVDSMTGELSGRVTFFMNEVEAHTAASKIVLGDNLRSGPVYVIPGTEFTREGDVLYGIAES